MEFHKIISYLQQHFLEILGTITGLIYVIYSIKQERVLWIYGGISSLFYILVFFQAGLYAYMTLYFYYTGISIYGWYAWSKNTGNGRDAFRTIRLKTRSWIFVVLSVALLSVMLWWMLRFLVHSDIAWADAVLTSGSIIATWMLMRKMIENWLLWIVIDILSGVVSLYKGLPFAAILFFIYTLLAVKGYIEWKKGTVKN
jgi:nicotinamide mononucleotide transporter